MHNNILTSLLADVTSRNLDRYFAVEEDFATQSTATAVRECEELINLDRGTVLDKTRALLCLFLAKPDAPEIQRLAESLARVPSLFLFFIFRL